jgi:hypothetical protein
LKPEEDDMAEPENLVSVLLREIRSEIAGIRRETGDIRSVMTTKSDIADVHSEVNSLRADVASDLLDMEKRLSDRINHLNRAVIEYHSSAVGHGVLISEFQERLLRVEQHLNLPPLAGH